MSVRALVEPEAVPPGEAALTGPACITSVDADAGFAFLAGRDGSYRLVRFDRTGLTELAAGRRPELSEPRALTLTCLLAAGGTALTARTSTDRVTSWASLRRGNDAVATGVVLVSPGGPASVIVREFRAHVLD